MYMYMYVHVHVCTYTCKLTKLFVQKVMSVDRDKNCFYGRLCQATVKTLLIETVCQSRRTVQQRLLQNAKSGERD